MENKEVQSKVPTTRDEAKQEIETLKKKIPTIDSYDELKTLYDRISVLRCYLNSTPPDSIVNVETDEVKMKTSEEKNVTTKEHKSHDLAKVVFLILTLIVSVFDTIQPYIPKIMEVLK